MSRFLRVALMLGALVVALAATSPTAHAEATKLFKFNTTENLAGTVSDHPCTGEPLVLGGALHTYGRGLISASGGIHLLMHLNAQHVTATASDGTVYHEAAAANEQTLNADSDFAPLNSSFTAHFRLLAPGPGNDVVLAIHAHVTVNANGEVTSSFDSFELTCP